MRTPSIKTLQQVFPDLTAAKESKRILQLVDTTTYLEEYPSVAAHRKACYHRPPMHYIKMLALNELAQLHGIEHINHKSGEYLTYLNTGDIYAATVIYWKGIYRVTSVDALIKKDNKFI